MKRLRSNKDSAASEGVPEMSPSGKAWKKWFKRMGERASADVVNATSTLVIEERDLVRTASPSVDEAAASKEYVRGLEDAAKACDDLRANRPTTERGLLIATECAEAIRVLISQHQETK